MYSSVKKLPQCTAVSNTSKDFRPNYRKICDEFNRTFHCRVEKAIGNLDSNPRCNYESLILFFETLQNLLHTYEKTTLRVLPEPYLAACWQLDTPDEVSAHWALTIAAFEATAENILLGGYRHSLITWSTARKQLLDALEKNIFLLIPKYVTGEVPSSPESVLLNQNPMVATLELPVSQPFILQTFQSAVKVHPPVQVLRGFHFADVDATLDNLEVALNKQKGLFEPRDRQTIELAYWLLLEELEYMSQHRRNQFIYYTRFADLDLIPVYVNLEKMWEELRHSGDFPAIRSVEAAIRRLENTRIVGHTRKCFVERFERQDGSIFFSGSQNDFCRQIFLKKDIIAFTI